jgi:hypothetical protein
MRIDELAESDLADRAQLWQAYLTLYKTSGRIERNMLAMVIERARLADLLAELRDTGSGLLG